MLKKIEFKSISDRLRIMTEISQSLKNRVYYAARDGMAVTLTALLTDQTEDVIKELLSQV